MFRPSQIVHLAAETGTAQSLSQATRAFTKLGWSQTDWQLFSDERALARAGPEKVCQLVHDWFAAQLAIKDPDMQLRLLVDSLKPVVAG